ncbi:amidohydrolase family protein [Leifsonia virtsii]|uniref:Amidohydrolase family protein n=1 Tax=Leifsonia virtsii TaxID=3035915 RepID=A0ABT8J230_9MICO|nr:amidohydrolase family protein [Leifsonia virtsii]MDN4599134.1 amidohydrolase family protein [Leifsonia virtsii]
MTERIDAHVHLWNRRTDPQDWIDPVTMAAIDRDFGSDDLRAMLASTGMERAVLVQASNSLEESERLSHADPSVVAGLVAWVDLTGDVPAQLDRVRTGRVPVVGVRHLAHIDPDPEWLLRPDVAGGLAALGGEGLVFDLVVRDWQLPQAAALAERHGDVRFVLDHLGGPLAGDADPAGWEKGLRALAAQGNVVAKVSGLTSGLVPGEWDADDLGEVVDVALDAFGPDRLLYGSDWPLAELGGGSPAWRSAFDELVSGLAAGERDALLGGNAARVYSLG